MIRLVHFHFRISSALAHHPPITRPLFLILVRVFILDLIEISHKHSAHVYVPIVSTAIFTQVKFTVLTLPEIAIIFGRVQVWSVTTPAA